MLKHWSNHRIYFIKKVFLKFLRNSETCNFIKQRDSPRHICFPVNFAKFIFLTQLETYVNLRSQNAVILGYFTRQESKAPGSCWNSILLTWRFQFNYIILRLNFTVKAISMIDCICLSTWKHKQILSNVTGEITWPYDHVITQMKTPGKWKYHPICNFSISFLIKIFT